MKRSKSFHNVEQLTGPAVPPQEARIQSIARAKAILDVLTVADRDWTPLRAIALSTGLAKTTAFNLVNALVEVGLVEHDPPRGAYRLGAQMLVYGRAVERRMDLVGLMRPYLLKLCTATRETVNLALPAANDILIVDSVEEVVTLQAGEIEPTPEFGAKIDTAYLLGMAKVKGAVKTLLDIDRVVAPETVQAIVQNT